MLYLIGYPDFILDEDELRKHYENVSKDDALVRKLFLIKT